MSITVQEHFIFGNVLSVNDDEIEIRIINDFNDDFTSETITLPYTWGYNLTRVKTNFDTKPNENWNNLYCLVRIQDIDGIFQIYPESILDKRFALTPNQRSFYLFSDSTMKRQNSYFPIMVVNEIQEYQSNKEDFEYIERLLKNDSSYSFIQTYAAYDYFDLLKEHSCDEKGAISKLLKFSLINNYNEEIIQAFFNQLLDANLEENLDEYITFLQAYYPNKIHSSYCVTHLENYLKQKLTSLTFIKQKIPSLESNLENDIEHSFVDFSNYPFIYGQIIRKNDEYYEINTIESFNMKEPLPNISLDLTKYCKDNNDDDSDLISRYIAICLDPNNNYMTCVNPTNDDNIKLLIPKQKTFFVFDNEKDFYETLELVKDYILERNDIKNEQEALRFLGKYVNVEDRFSFIRQNCIDDFVNINALSDTCWKTTAISVLEQFRRSKNLSEQIQIEIDSCISLDKLNINAINNSIDFYNKIIQDSENENYTTYSKARLVEIKKYLDNEMKHLDTLIEKVKTLKKPE